MDKVDQPLSKPPTNTAEYVITHPHKSPELQESDFQVSETSSVGSGTSSCSRRVSLMFTSSKRGTGVEMDLVTGEANDLLQKGKGALESAGKIKREAKADHDSLHGSKVCMR